MRRIVYSVSSFLSCLAIVGCNFKGNTDMQKEGKINCQKWDAFAAKVGVPGCDQAVPATDKAGLVKNLSEMPQNFVAGSAKYAEVTKLVQNYVSQIGAKTQATEIVSVKKLADVLVEAGFADQLTEVTKPEFISIPYYERDKVTPTDLSAIKTLSGINKDSKFKIYSTKEGKVDTSDFAEGTAYVLIYKLNGSEQKYSSIVTIPDKKSDDEKFKVIMYAHGGDAGISFRNMATILQNNLGKGVVAAPSFPGEPICSITTIGGSVENNFIRSCGDAKGNIIKPAVAAEGEKSPLDNDVNSFLGLHNAIARMAITSPKKAFIVKGNVDNDFSKRIFPDIKGPKLEYYTDNQLLLSLTGPKTIGVSDSRGGATLLAAVGRTGIMLKSTLEGGLGNIDFKNPPILPLFSSAGLFYTPSTLLIGSFRIVTQNMLAGNIYDTSILNALPMIPDLKKNSYFTNYRITPLGQDQKELNELVGWIGASDIVFLAPYISVGMQNWDVLIRNIPTSFSLMLKNLLIKENLSSGDANYIKFLLQFLIDISSPMPGSNKSIFSYFADSLEKNINTVGAKCNIFAKTVPAPITDDTDCSIYNIFINGDKGLGIDGIIKKDDLPKLIEFFKALGDKDIGIISLLNEKSDKIKNLKNIYDKLEKLNFSKDKFSDLLKLTMSSSLSLAYNADNIVKLTKEELNFVEKKIVDKEFSINGSANKLLVNSDNINEQVTSMSSIIMNELLSVIKTAPGSIIFLHSTQDGVVPYTQSFIAKKAMDTVFDAVYGSVQIPNNPLTSFNIPAVGSQLFAFQPEDRFYAVNLGEKTSDGSVCAAVSYDGKSAANYNPDVKKCFGKMALNKSGDGSFAHGDTAVRTARLISAPLQGLGYNDADKASVINSLLYGNQEKEKLDQSILVAPKPIPSVMAKTVSVIDQLKTFNKYISYSDYKDKELFKDLLKDPKFEFYSIQCDKSVTGMRYLINACDESKNYPLFQRALYQDYNFSERALKEGAVVSSDQLSNLTPTDIFTLWMESAAKEASN